MRPSRTLPRGGAGELDPEERAKAEALKAVVADAVAFEEAVAKATPMESWRTRPIVFAAIAVPCLAIYLYTAIARPEWVYGPDVARTAPAQREAHLRFAMVLMAERVNAYRVSTGALPETLLEVGEDWRDIGYTVVDGTAYELRAAVDSTRAIVLQSSDDPVAFLGSSRRLLREQNP